MRDVPVELLVLLVRDLAFRARSALAWLTASSPVATVVFFSSDHSSFCITIGIAM